LVIAEGFASGSDCEEGGIRFIFHICIYIYIYTSHLSCS
jgi:hypothetical protein